MPEDPVGEAFRLQRTAAGNPDVEQVSSRRRTGTVVLGSALAGALTAGCATTDSISSDGGAQQAQTRTVSAVSAVDLAVSGELVLTRGDPPSLRISAGSEVIDHLTSDVHDDRLTLGSDGSVRTSGRIRYDLVLPAARVVDLSGSGSVHVTGPSTLQQVLLPGSGDVRVDLLTTEELTVDLSGSGQVTVAGSATRQRISIGGSGRYSAGGLASQDAEVTISGSGSADVTAGHVLTVTVSGTGSVTYGGDAAVTSSVTGHGSVVRR
jgi:hypothetical protein